MGKYIKCVLLMIGSGTELHSVKGNQINSSTVNVIVEL